MYFYLEQAGYSEPWLDDKTFVAASGDDVVCWVDSSDSQRVGDVITQLTARSKAKDNIGLGQCVKEVFIREWWDIDFCSKWSFVGDKSSVESWTLTRDF